MSLFVIAYLSIIVFAAATLYRLIKVASAPAHLRWDLYPIPHEGSRKAKYGGSYYEELDWWTKPRHVSKFTELSAMLPEILLLKGVWEANRSLWFWSWAFHFGLYLAIGIDILLILATILGPASAVGALIMTLTVILAIFGYILGALGCLGMLMKRMTDPKLTMFTTSGAIFNLIFILAIFATGLTAIISVGPNNFIGQFQQFVAGLVTFNIGELTFSPAVTIHLATALVFLAYMPFTHMAHFILKYFTYHSIRWNDQPNIAGSKLEKKIIEALNYKPTWAAKHIRADGKKTWVDIAVEEVYKDEQK